jgi:hypothetical protein
VFVKQYIKHLSHNIYINFQVTSDLQETKSRVRDNLEREYAGDDKERKSHKPSSSAPSSSSSRDHQSGYDSSKKSDDPKKKKPSSSGPKHAPPPSFADLVGCLMFFVAYF